MHTSIYKMRTKLRITQPELAERTGISQSQISKYEKGEITRPSYEKLVRIAEALRCTVEDITDRESPSEVKSVFQAFTDKNAAIYIPLFGNERQSMNTDFQHGDGFIIRPGGSPNQTKKPSFLDYSDTAYAVTTYSDAMEPRYQAGDVVFVDPKLDAQQRDDVVLTFQVGDKLIGMIRECVEVNESSIKVKDLKVNSGKPTVSFHKSDLYGVHVIVGTQKYRG